MGTMIDLSEDQAEALGRLSEDERQTCAALIQATIANYLVDRERFSEAGRAERRAAMEAAFGIWKDRGIDGLDYQRAIRAEWDRDWDPD